MNSKFLNRLTALAVVVSLVAATGCKKYLDQQPITDVDASKVFSDVPSA
ncbi:MAG: hypothetical protein IPM85_00290 [Chitinophagaceae bacterium]|nr:hypothetical protein [Chitinophagaceae bacterium]